MKSASRIRCPKENVWALMQEPYVKGFTDWMIERQESFFHVYTHHPLPNDPKYIVSHPALPWHVNKTFDELSSMDMPVKSKTASWIVGNARDLPGHLKRFSFLDFIQKKAAADIDLFGRAVRAIEDKWDGLAPYKYSLAVENSCGPDYWTEKLADCFLSWTVPFYYGCTNLDAYFPEASFIRIDIEKPKAAMARIESAIKNDEWEKRLPALNIARQRVLNRYQIFPHLTKLIQAHHPASRQKTLTLIPPYRRSVKTHLNRAVYKIKMGLKKRLAQS
jgi:hypothetical protein